MATRTVSPKSAKASSTDTVHVQRIASQSYAITIVGTTGLYLHKMSQKAQRDLLLAREEKDSRREAEDQARSHQGVSQLDVFLSGSVA